MRSSRCAVRSPAVRSCAKRRTIRKGSSLPRESSSLRERSSLPREGSSLPAHLRAREPEGRGEVPFREGALRSATFFACESRHLCFRRHSLGARRRAARPGSPDFLVTTLLGMRGDAVRRRRERPFARLRPFSRMALERPAEEGERRKRKGHAPAMARVLSIRTQRLWWKIRLSAGRRTSLSRGPKSIPRPAWDLPAPPRRSARRCSRQ